MDKNLFEQLLFEEESTTLDFKKEQYRFVKATEDDKSELLKDILGFANAWRRSEAYILIGVEEIRGGRSNVVGIEINDHLDDHALQQFVNNLVNQPIQFEYQAFDFDGKQVGIIKIEQQGRPVYLKRDYGKLEKEKIYVRRGSSTDPTKPAKPEEIARMNVSSDQTIADIEKMFADINRNDILGQRIYIKTERCQLPDEKDIPKLKSSSHPDYVFDILSQSRINNEYYVELAQYELWKRLFREVRFSIKNAGQVAAKNIRVEISTKAGEDIALHSYAEALEKPVSYQSSYFDGLMPVNVANVWGRDEPGIVEISKNDERYLIEIECGDLQPGRQIFSEGFYIGKAESGKGLLKGVILADNLPKPRIFTLEIDFVVQITTLTVDELISDKL